MISSGPFKIFFGDAQSNGDSLEQQFPHFKFKKIKQVHGDRIVHASAHTINFSAEADAHYTHSPNVALCISTADCVPLMICHQDPTWIMAIHAGWRGVANRIIPKAIAQLLKNDCDPRRLKFFIGPHIQFESFEVGNDVRDQLVKSVQSAPSAALTQISDQKSKVDLHQLVLLQILECGAATKQVTAIKKDTVTDKTYHSFRRDRESSGRNLSFIVSSHI